MAEWRCVPGFEGRYDVSDEGGVCARERIAVTSRGKQRWPAKLLKPFVDSSTGYLCVNLCDGARAKKFSVHRLVLLAFVGESPRGYQACHNDGVRTNCHLSNLRWDTVSGNAQDRIRHGTQQRGERSPRAKLTEGMVRVILASDESSRVLGNRLGVAGSTIRAVRIGQNWKESTQGVRQ